MKLQNFFTKGGEEALRKIKETDTIMALESARSEYEHMKRDILIQGVTLPSKPSKDGVYRVYVPDPTKKSGRRQVSSASLEGLKDKIYKSLTSNEKGRFERTFAEVYALTENERLKYVKNKEKRLSVINTNVRYRQAYKRFIEGTAFEKMFISEIGKTDIEDLIFMNLSRYSLREKGLASLRRILKPAFDLAYSSEWIMDNPYSRVDFRKYQNMLEDDVPVEERSHSDEDIERMLDAIHEHQKAKPSYIPAYALEMQIITAFRRAELPPLTWYDIKDTHVSVHREQLSIRDVKPERFEIVSHTKTGNNRIFPLTKDLREFLRRLKDVHEKYYPASEFLFPDANTENGCITNNVVYLFYRRLCKKLGIKICREITKGTHAFRRTRITEVANKSGGNLLLASQLFGNSPEVAKKHYYTGINVDEALKVLEG